MTLLVTGASGFIGPALIAGLTSKDRATIAVSRTKPRQLPDGSAWKPRSEVLGGNSDILPSAVIHLEVKQHVSNPSASDLHEFSEVNVHGTERWLNWAAAHRVRRFVLFSSIKAAGESPECQDESSRSLPSTPYGESKLAAERKVTEWAAGSPERSGLILRPAVVYGPGNHANMFSLVEAIYRRRFFLAGKNENVKSLISLRNLVAAVNHILALPLTGPHVFYLTDKESFSVAEVARMISEILQNDSLHSLPLPIAKSAALFGDVFVRLTGKSFPLTSNRLKALLENTHYSCAKLQSTGFVHPQSTREGMEEMVSWYLSTRSRENLFRGSPSF